MKQIGTRFLHNPLIQRVRRHSRMTVLFRSADLSPVDSGRYQQLNPGKIIELPPSQQVVQASLDKQSVYPLATAQVSSLSRSPVFKDSLVEREPPKKNDQILVQSFPVPKPLDDHGGTRIPGKQIKHSDPTDRGWQRLQKIFRLHQAESLPDGSVEQSFQIEEEQPTQENFEGDLIIRKPDTKSMDPHPPNEQFSQGEGYPQATYHPLRSPLPNDKTNPHSTQDSETQEDDLLSHETHVFSQPIVQKLQISDTDDNNSLRDEINLPEDNEQFLSNDSDSEFKEQITHMPERSVKTGKHNHAATGLYRSRIDPKLKSGQTAKLKAGQTFEEVEETQEFNDHKPEFFDAEELANSMDTSQERPGNEGQALLDKSELMKNLRPLQDAWPVQRITNQSDDVINDDPSKPVRIEQIPISSDEIGTQDKEKDFSQKVSKPGIEIIDPRKSRLDVINEALKMKSHHPTFLDSKKGIKPDSSNKINHPKVSPTIADKFTGPEESDDMQVVETEIGSLPVDLWSLLGQSAPEQPEYHPQSLRENIGPINPGQPIQKFPESPAVDRSQITPNKISQSAKQLHEINVSQIGEPPETQASIQKQEVKVPSQKPESSIASNEKTIDIDKLAIFVYQEIRRRLGIERERRPDWF